MDNTNNRGNPIRKERLTRSEKNSNKKQWYKDKIEGFSNLSSNEVAAFGFSNTEGGLFFSNNPSHADRMKVNYDLFNGIINKKDFESITKPFGDDIGELPGRFTNKDIISGKIKAVLGLEMKKPFEWRIVAVNSEATSRKEKEIFGRIQSYVVNSIVAPIKQQLEQQAMEQTKGEKLNADENYFGQK